MADAERGQRIAIGISASQISEVDFPQGNWKGECEGDFLKGLTFHLQGNDGQAHAFKVFKVPSVELQ